MARILVFENLSLDGFFTDANGEMGFAKGVPHDEEFDALVGRNAGAAGMMLFGRITYEMMASFWPTAAAEQMMPEVARGMNARPKLVFSRTLRETAWANTKLAAGDPVQEVRRLKSADGPDLAVLGSGTVVSQLARERLVDEYQFAVVPVILGAGRTLFGDVRARQGLVLKDTRTFRNGIVWLTYEGAR